VTAKSGYFLFQVATSDYNLVRPSVNFTARATLPVGAGLGSSASFSTCAATALLLLHKRIDIPAVSQPPPPNSPHRETIPRLIAEEVNQWAFVAEKILHGNPSGVDNSVAVFGGALAYTRPGFGKKGGMETIQGWVDRVLLFYMGLVYNFASWLLKKSYRSGSLQFLLTNSKVPRDTKRLVAGVAQKKLEVSGVIGRIHSQTLISGTLGSKTGQRDTQGYREHKRRS
jgi:mevalonate kinase